MKLSELVSLGITEIRNRTPLSAVNKFKDQTIQGQSGRQLLASAVSRYNCRIIPIASFFMIICTFAALLFEGAFAVLSPSGLAGEILLLFTCVCGIGFGFYFSGRYPAYYPYIFWSLFIISYFIRVVSCGTGAEGLALTAITLVVLCAVPVFNIAVSAVMIFGVAVSYSVVCYINDVYSYYYYVIIGMGVLCFIVSLSSYTLLCTRLINSKQIKEGQERIKLNSLIDARTGLYNRSYGIEKVNAMIKAGKNIAVLLIDIDSFGEYNRIYGMEQADRTLQRIANCVKIVSKPQTDIICRVDGDRIMVCMPANSDREAVLLCEDIRSSIKTMNIDFTENRPMLSVTVSVSVARNVPGEIFDDVFEKALKYLAQAKKAGGNCIGFNGKTFRPQ